MNIYIDMTRNTHFGEFLAKRRGNPTSSNFPIGEYPTTLETFSVREIAARGASGPLRFAKSGLGKLFYARATVYSNGPYSLRIANHQWMRPRGIPVYRLSSIGPCRVKGNTKMVCGSYIWISMHQGFSYMRWLVQPQGCTKVFG